MGRDLLFELGVEEIPPAESSRLVQQLYQQFEALIFEERLNYREIESHHTPRRLVLIVSDLDEEQPAMTTEVRGPSKKVAFDDEGTPSKAALGFCKGNGIDISELYVKDVPEGEYVFAKKEIPSKPTPEVLSELLPMLIDKLSPSETMRWDNSGIKFIRPIRWIVALFGNSVVKFNYGEVTSGQHSRGHRFLGEGQIVISDVSEYSQKMADNGVVLSEAARKEKITSALAEISQEISAEPSMSEALHNEIANNLEHPAPVLGQFPEEFLKLPREILESTIVEHQKFVPFVNGDEPSQYFVGFRDGSDGADEQVRAGYERVVKARLRDSEFFFDEDRKTPLEELTKTLERVVYQEKLGSIWDKTERMRKIAALLSERVGFTNRDEIDRTLFLCKADLLTTMVGEFPELEGIVGGLYARLEGEPELVAQGIYEHYKPKSAHDALPESETGIAASLADKLDTVIGSFLIGAEVTGSRDPFGLRRRANGIIRIVVERELDFDLYELIDSTHELYAFLGNDLDFATARDFFTERLKAELKDQFNIAYDIVDAVIEARDGNLLRTLKRARALEKIKAEEQFQSLVVAFERAANITRKEQVTGNFDSKLFSDPAEQELEQAVENAELQISALITKEDFDGIIEQLIELRKPIDAYFEAVHVMDPDEVIRSNRLAFLAHIVQLFSAVGDLSKIVVEGERD